MVLSRKGKAGTPDLLLSPNSVLANALLRSIDLLRPRVLAARPSRIEFVVGTQINGAPHLGTNLVQTAAFLLAKIARREFCIDCYYRAFFDSLGGDRHRVRGQDLHRPAGHAGVPGGVPAHPGTHRGHPLVHRPLPRSGEHPGAVPGVRVGGETRRPHQAGQHPEAGSARRRRLATKARVNSRASSVWATR
ncbi:hypothetical protein [Amycolatopsis thermophila]|uniref:Uncharacterized protein n=1 Tax=Amycolatopsis thermophila TaxID=206084 RepID=A0ABU0F1M4_9PSEU|nr:hypothetical protein [Amycolatopsis thermophila]MDQ0381479.1 hypothetical protein [Amycolatopsis thermophila]